MKLIKKFSLLAFTIIIGSSPVMGMNKQLATTSSQSKYKLFTKKNAVIVGSIGAALTIAYGAHITYSAYKIYRDTKKIINAPEKPSLEKELKILVRNLQEKTGRGDLYEQDFTDLLKKEDEFADIFENLNNETVSLEKLLFHVKTLKDYQTTYLDILTEHITPHLPIKKEIRKEEQDNKKKEAEPLDVNKTIRDENEYNTKIADTFIKTVCLPAFNNDALFSKNKNIYKKSIEQLCSYTIQDIKTKEIKTLENYLLKNISTLKNYKKMFAFYNIMNHLSQFEELVKNIVHKKYHDCAVAILEMYLKNAYAITAKSDYQTMLKVFNELEHMPYDFIQGVKDLIPYIITKQSKINITIPEKLYPVCPRDIIYLYCTKDHKNNSLFSSYLSSYKRYKEAQFIYEICYKYHYAIDQLKTGEKEFYEQLAKKTIKNDKQRFFKILKEDVLTKANYLNEFTLRIIPIIQQDQPQNKELHESFKLLQEKLNKDMQGISLKDI